MVPHAQRTTRTTEEYKPRMWSGLVLSGFLVAVLTVTVRQASAQAPGDEDDRCLNRRAQAGDVYPPLTQMLMDSRNYEELITGTQSSWQALDVDGSGRGWRSSLGGLCGAEPRSCDYTESTSQNNWFFTQYIRYVNAREVFVNFSTSFFQCSLQPSCSNRYVDVYRYERNERNDDAAKTTSNYGQRIQRIQLPNGFIASQLYNVSFTFTPSGNFNGFYIGVSDDGTCVDIRRFQVYYRASLMRTDGLVTYPEIALPALGSNAAVTDVAMCAANSVNLTSLQVMCFADGRCQDVATCACNRGYEYLDSMPPSCRACPPGTFQPYLNSTNPRTCIPCPANSTAAQSASPVCQCDFDFTRNDERPEDPCTRPPSSPRISIANPPSLARNVNGNSLEVCWLKSVDGGGSPDLHYNIYTLEAGDTMYTLVSTVQPTQGDLICTSVQLNALSSYSVVVTAASGATNDPVSFSDVSVVQDRFIVFYVTTCAAGLPVAAAVAITFFVTLIFTAIITTIIVVVIFLLFRKKSSSPQSTSSISGVSNGKEKPPPPPRPTAKPVKLAKLSPYPTKDGNQQIIHPTVFPRIDAAAFIYFAGHFGAASTRGWCLFEGGVYYFGQYDRTTYTASLVSSPSKCVDKLVRRYGSYKSRSRNIQKQQLTMGKCRPRLEQCFDQLSLSNKAIHTGRG